MVACVTLILVALTFLPMLALGPLAEKEFIDVHRHARSRAPNQ